MMRTLLVVLVLVVAVVLFWAGGAVWEGARRAVLTGLRHPEAPPVAPSPTPVDWRPGTVRPVCMVPVGVLNLAARQHVRMAFTPRGAGENVTVDIRIDRTVTFGLVPEATHVAYADNTGADLFYLDVNPSAPITIRGSR